MGEVGNELSMTATRERQRRVAPFTVVYMVRDIYLYFSCSPPRGGTAWRLSKLFAL
jgi:hypothetical protein